MSSMDIILVWNLYSGPKRWWKFKDGYPVTIMCPGDVRYHAQDPREDGFPILMGELWVKRVRRFPCVSSERETHSYSPRRLSWLKIVGH